MIVVIIAGGSGTRLWPLSTPEYPKHLLNLTNEHSLLQNTLSRVESLTSLDNIFIVSEVSHVDHVKKQLPKLSSNNILAEPGRRGTASCVLLALSEIKKRQLPDSSILFLWADHQIRDTDGFTATVLRAGQISEAKKQLVFIGVEPTYPATGFGYIERDGKIKGWENAYKLASFKEKPNRGIAEAYFRSGKYLWNTGYLVGCLTTFENLMQRRSKHLWEKYQSLLDSSNVEKTYLSFDSEQLDTALSEKVDEGIALPGNFDWIDVGSFRELHSISVQDENGNHVKGKHIATEHTANSYIRNDTNKPLAIIGLDNVVIVSTPNGTLVVNKNYAQSVGEISKSFH
jgi:mannose-1-phosphate guanylyltransferase